MILFYTFSCNILKLKWTWCKWNKDILCIKRHIYDLKIADRRTRSKRTRTTCCFHVQDTIYLASFWLVQGNGLESELNMLCAFVKTELQYVSIDKRLGVGFHNVKCLFVQETPRLVLVCPRNRLDGDLNKLWCFATIDLDRFQ